MAETLIFHYRDSGSFLTRFNPFAKLIALLSYSAAISSAAPPAVCCLAFLPVAAAIKAKLPLKKCLHESAFFIVLSALMIVTSLFSGRSVIESVSAGISFLSLVLAAILLTDSTMPDELARSAGSALAHIAGKYAYILASVMEITLSMIPMIVDSAVGITDAMKSRGASFSSRPVRFLSQFSQSMLSDLLDKAEIYTDALYSRGYDASMRRSAAPYHPRDFLMIAVSLSYIPLRIYLEQRGA